MSLEVRSSWLQYEKLPLGTLNRINKSLFKRRLHTGQEESFSSILADIFEDTYGYDTKAGSGPFLAVVLQVLDSPKINSAAANKDRPNSKNPSQFDDPSPEDFDTNKKSPRVRVIAKVPEFDADLDWPGSDKDFKLIQLHSEFVQSEKSKKTIENIEQGSVVWVQYVNDNYLASFNGKPAGYIMGVHNEKAHTTAVTRLNVNTAFNPPCKVRIDKDKPAAGFYTGDRPGTEPDPAPSLIDLKIKNHIKTGMFGNGHPRTKAHFKEALLTTENVNPAGPVPGPNNSFIWVGYLKNNGYMDLLDRPNDRGRETIVYAPATLDLNAPVEIKYYLHDVGGFGSAHVNGPDMPTAQAVFSAKIKGNDFSEKVAPAIQSLNMQGRNYVLVIPEMAYSRGYGTRNDDLKRVEKLIDGDNIGTGAGTESTSTTVRTSPTPEIRGVLKEYLSNIPVEQGKTLAQNTPLRLRQLSTFDGTYSGGDFGKFHDEVLDVLDEYIYNSVGGVFDKIEFISFVADGLGSIALGSILNKVANSATQAQAASSLKNLFNREVGLRIDYITTPELDSSPNFYSSFFGTESPSSVLLNELLLPREDIFYTEFNYITSPDLISRENVLFNRLGKDVDYRKNLKSPGTGKSANKFSFRLGNSEADQRFVTMHVVKEPSRLVTKNKVEYAFSMINDYLPNSIKYPKKGDKNSQLKPGFSAVPDHHKALSATKSPSDLDKLETQLAELTGSVGYFTKALNTIINPPSGGSIVEGYFTLCQDSKYKQFCSANGVVEQGDNSLFNIEYRKYLQKLKKIEEIKILLDPNQGGPFIEQNRGIPSALQNLEKQYFVLYENTKADIEQNFVSENENTKQFWEALNTGIKEFETRLTQAQQGSGVVPDLQNLAILISRPEAYAKLLNKTRSYLKDLQEPTLKKPDDCVPPPIKLDDIGTQTSSTTRPEGSNCEKIQPLLGTPPEDFQTLRNLLGYDLSASSPDPPRKKDFEFSKKEKVSKTRVKTTSLPATFQGEVFSYEGRGPNNVPQIKYSPPVWACLQSTFREKWAEACQASKYFPFVITSGFKASEKLKVGGVCAYSKGLSLHAFGMAIDIDPHLNIQSQRRFDPVYSVWTGAWSRNLLGGPFDKDILQNFKRLHELGVFRDKPEDLSKNVFIGGNILIPRSTSDWQGAPYANKSQQGSDNARQRGYDSEMNITSGVHEYIVPLDANPTLWVIEFCERTGLRWGNTYFMKKRFKGGKIWTEPEKKEISNIYKIPDVVDRIQAISWNETRLGDQHMRFDFWAGSTGLIPWKEIEDFVKSKKTFSKITGPLDQFDAED